MLRLVRAMPIPDTPAPTHVGVDDWAMRKGCSYGTIVVDLDRHRVVDLLPDRTAATLAVASTELVEIWKSRAVGGAPHIAEPAALLGDHRAPW